MNARERAIAAHPAGKALISAEVAQARMDDEACTLGSTNWQPTQPQPEPEPELAPSRRQDIAHVTGICVAILAIANTAPVLHGLAGSLA